MYLIQQRRMKMTKTGTTLGDRGKAIEDAWAREEDRKAIERMKEKDAQGKGKDDKGGDKGKAKGDTKSKA
jgi:hypothetical protein